MRTVRLGDVVEIQLGKMLSPKSKTGLRPMPYLRNANVQWDRFDLVEVHEMDFDVREEQKFLLKPGDVLVCEGGEPGRAAVWTGAIDPCLYQKALHRLRPIEDIVDPQFLVYRLWLGAHRGELVDGQAKSTIAHLPAVRLAELQLQIPPIWEQRRIAAQINAHLADVGRARTGNISRSTANRMLAAAVLHRWFGPDATSTWDRPTLATLLRSPLRTGISAAEVPDGGLPGLSLGAIRNGRLDLTESKRVDVDASTNRLVREGRFYIVRGNGRLDLVGRAGLAPRPTSPVVFPDLLIEADLDPAKVRPEFFQLVWDSREVRADVEARARTASGIHKINLANLGRVCVPMPGLDEQRRVAAELRERLATIDAMESAIRVEREAIDALPAALLRRAFDGQAA